MTAKKIHTTKDYGSFRLIKSNRSVVATHVNKLVRNIEAKNMLHLFPIIVNSDMRIIEGQHRHAAAKQLGVNLYYIVDDEVKPADIAAINSTRKSWNVKDYVNHFAAEGVKEHKKLKSLIEAYPLLTVMAALRLMEKSATSYFSGGNASAKMRMGVVDATNYDLAVLICDFALRLREKWSYSFFPNFLLGLKSVILSTPDLDPEEIFKRILKRSHFLPQTLFVQDGVIREIKDLIAIK